MPAKPSVFISYRRQPAADLARYLHHRLSTLGFDAFLDVETINGGRFANIIQREIINRDVFLVILTPETLQSEWVVREVKTALDHEKPIVPLAAQGFSFSLSLPTEIQDLGNYDAVRWENDFADAAFERLVKAIDPRDKRPTLARGWLTIGAIIVLLAIVGILLNNRNNIGTSTAIDPTATLSPTRSNTPAPTATQSILPNTTATRVVDFSATQTEAILQRTADVLEQTSNAVLIENTRIAETATANHIMQTPTLSTVFTIGSQAVVLYNRYWGTVQYVRIRPGGAVVTSLFEGVVITIIGGPEVDGEAVWWQIRTPDDIEGWMVEATGGYQNIIPLSAGQIAQTATAQALPTVTDTPYLTPPPPFNTSGLRIGGQARVKFTAWIVFDVVNVPSLDSHIVAELSDGAIVTILDGPVAADDVTWWKVRTSDGIEGWAPEVICCHKGLVPIAETATPEPAQLPTAARVVPTATPSPALPP